jgi:hypothetical protein
MGDENHYALLGVSPDATEADIRNAFAREIKKSHPDLSNEADVARTRRLIEAKAILTDPERRRAYDSGLGSSNLIRSSSRGPRQWIFVCAHGLGQYRTVAEAVRAARDGDKLFILPGLYQEPTIRVEKPIEIVGQPTPDEDVVIEATDDDGVYLSGAAPIIRGLVFRTLKRRAFGIIAATQKGAVISSCRLHAESGTGIVVADGALLIEGCSFEHCRHGLRVENAQAQIVASKFVSNITGLLLRSSADCAIENCHFENQEASAVEAQSDTTVNITRSRFERGAAGIIVSRTTRGVIDQNRFIGLTRNTTVLTPDGGSEVMVMENVYE